jgi:hypothetical protein
MKGMLGQNILDDGCESFAVRFGVEVLSTVEVVFKNRFDVFTKVELKLRPQ